METDPVLISRNANDSIGGVRRTGRVYITAHPEILQGVYSSTENRTEATVFDRAEAERLLALGKWSGSVPVIEDAR